MQRIADELYTWRRTYRLSQVAVAERLGVSARTVGRWERREAKPSAHNARELRWAIAKAPAGWQRDAE